MNNYIEYKYWECECCGLSIPSPQQNDVSKYKCPACEISKCEHGGKFIEITTEEFIKNSNLNI